MLICTVQIVCVQYERTCPNEVSKLTHCTYEEGELSGFFLVIPFTHVRETRIKFQSLIGVLKRVLISDCAWNGQCPLPCFTTSQSDGMKMRCSIFLSIMTSMVIIALKTFSAILLKIHSALQKDFKLLAITFLRPDARPFLYLCHRHHFFVFLNDFKKKISERIVLFYHLYFK